MTTASANGAERPPLRVERDAAGYAVLTIDVPDTGNALSRALRRTLADTVATLAAEPAVRVLILTAAGRLFTAGLDIREWRDDDVAAGAFDDDPVLALRGFPGPVIGAINGPAITGGFEIAVACDLLVASERASFIDTHTRVGLLPGWGLSARLPRIVGAQRARQLALTGDRLDAQRALDWGLVAEVVPHERLMDAARAIALRMLAGEPATLVEYKRLLDDGIDAPLADALALERTRALRWNAAVSRDTVLARIRAMRAPAASPRRADGSPATDTSTPTNPDPEGPR